MIATVAATDYVETHIYVILKKYVKLLFVHNLHKIACVFSLGNVLPKNAIIPWKCNSSRKWNEMQ